MVHSIPQNKNISNSLVNTFREIKTLNVVFGIRKNNPSGFLNCQCWIQWTWGRATVGSCHQGLSTQHSSVKSKVCSQQSIEEYHFSSNPFLSFSFFFSPPPSLSLFLFLPSPPPFPSPLPPFTPPHSLLFSPLPPFFLFLFLLHPPPPSLFSPSPSSPLSHPPLSGSPLHPTLFSFSFFFFSF